MELEEAIEILNNYLCETHRKFCSIGSVGVPNKEYFAIETVLDHLTKQEKMIDRMSKALHLFIWKNDEKIMITSKPKVSCQALSIEDIKQYFEKKVEENK